MNVKIYWTTSRVTRRCPGCLLIFLLSCHFFAHYGCWRMRCCSWQNYAVRVFHLVRDPSGLSRVSHYSQARVWRQLAQKYIFGHVPMMVTCQPSFSPVGPGTMATDLPHALGMVAGPLGEVMNLIWPNLPLLNQGSFTTFVAYNIQEKHC